MVVRAKHFSSINPSGSAPKQRSQHWPFRFGHSDLAQMESYL